MSHCAYCRGPLTGPGHAGRPWPGHAAAAYCCFGCLSLGEQQRQEASSPVPRANPGGLGVRLGVGILVVGQSMIFGLALNLHDDVPPAVRHVAQWCILAATLLVVALLGGPLFRTAWGELRRGRLTLEALFLLTMTGAMAASLQAHLTGRGKIYFEVVSVLLVVYTLGKLIGARSRAAALASSRAWSQQLATCRVNGRIVPVREVRVGDVVEVYPGETIAVDGVIRDGVGFVSEAVVSGEPFAVTRRPGDRVLAGTASHDATFRIEATSPGTDRQVDRLLAAVEAARDRPLSLQGQADRLGRLFFPLVVLTSVATFGYWTWAAGWETGLFNAMAVLLVACPCVIGLATPIVVWNAVGRLAERGLIVRSGDAVERLAEVDCVLFDKTGTLTEDRFALLDIATVAEGDERAKVLGWMSVVEAQCNHPVAKPFAQLPRADVTVTSLTTVAGCGVSATIRDAGGALHCVHIGRPEWVQVAAGKPAVPSELQPARRASPPLPGLQIDAAIDGELAAVAVLAERPRDSVPEMLATFRDLGIPVEVLTGDASDRAAALGLPARTGMLPDDKREAVEAIRAAGGRPLVVGDGINDAAALATAHVGIALSSGTDLAVGASAVTLYHGDLRVLPWAVQLSRAAVRSVRRNLCRALFYNVVGMALAASGALHPVVAAVLMVVSSLSLVFSASRVGVTPDHCAAPAERGPLPRAVVHGLAVALQGVVFLQLVPAFGAGGVIAFALVGVGLAYLWHRWNSIPHALDMCAGMLTLGNLGMLLGWWADNGFAVLHATGCCLCATTLRPWMWIGMLAFANAAMVRLARRSAPSGDHRLAMFTGGNAGMVAGMLAGGWVVAQFGIASIPTAAAASFAGMTAGMLGGMLFGAWAAEGLIAAVRRVVTRHRLAANSRASSPTPFKSSLPLPSAGSDSTL
jgi:heavy metal translocating P-type ATPase